MFEKIDKKKLAGLMLAGVITVTGTTSAFAADQPSSKPAAVSQKQFFKFDKADLSTKIKSAIDSLVTAGTITQAQADAVTKAYTPGNRNEMFRGEFKNPMSELVTAGTITQEQADAINSAVKTGIESQKSIEDIFAGLVTAGTITEAQKVAVLNVFPRKDNFSKHMKFSKSSIDNLVTSGTITQAQADAIENALKPGKDFKPAEEVLDGLVSAETITQAQEDAILKAIPFREEKFMNKEEHKGFLDSLVTAGTITEAQAETIGSALKSGREEQKTVENILQEMVAKGTITQVQSDAIQKTFPPFEGKGLFMKFKNNPMDELVTAGTITQAQADAINAAVKSALGSVDKR